MGRPVRKGDVMMKPLECGHVYPNGSGRRKRCPACAEAHHKTQMAEWYKENYYYKKKRSTS